MAVNNYPPPPKPAYTPYTAADATRAVEVYGGPWMYAHDPDWLVHIDLNRLSLSSHTCCILGQDADHVLPAVRVAALRGAGLVPAYHLVEGWYADSDDWAAKHGFSIVPPTPVTFLATDGVYTEIRARWEMLTIAWRTYIAAELARRTLVLEPARVPVMAGVA